MLNTINYRQISITLLSGLLLIPMGITKEVQANTLSLTDIVQNWSAELEPGDIYEMYSTDPWARSYGRTATWAIDNTFNTVDYEAITNWPLRIPIDSNQEVASTVSGSLISDFQATTDFTFSTSVYFPNDDDAAGLVWGYQDEDNHYRLSWDSGGKVDLKNQPGVAYEGDNVGKGLNIIKEVNGIKTVLGSSNTLYWDQGITYDVMMTRQGNDIDLSISDGLNMLFSTTITDNSFIGGNVGFFTAGVEVLYSDVQFADLDSNTQNVPEPLTILGSATAIAYGAFFKRKTGLGIKKKGEIK